MKPSLALVSTLAGASALACASRTAAPPAPPAAPPPPAAPASSTPATCVDEVREDREGTFVRLTDGTWRAVRYPEVDGSLAVLDETDYVPSGISLEPEAGPWVTHVPNDGSGMDVVLRDRRDRVLIRHGVPFPATPAVDEKGRIGATGDPCAIGVSGLSWWDADSVVIQIEHSVSGLCEGRIPPVCTLLALRTPKDLPTGP